MAGTKAGRNEGKGKKDVFSVIKAVKKNARIRLGTPPLVVTIPDAQKAERGPVKHRRTSLM